MRTKFALLQTACAAIVLVCGQAAFAAADERPIQFYNPEGMQRWVYSYGVSTASWVKTASIEHVLPSDQSGDLKAQMVSALDNLDKQLAQHGAGRGAILKLNTAFVGSTLQQTREVSDVIKSYLAAKANTSEGGLTAEDFPIRTAFGVDALDTPNLKVALDVEFVDTKNIPSSLIADSSARKAHEGARTLSFGGVTGQRRDFTIEGYPQAGEEAKASVGNLKKILAQANMKLGDVKTLTVYYGEPPQVAAAQNGVKVASADMSAVPAVSEAKPANLEGMRAEVEGGIKAAFLENGAKLPQVIYKAVRVACFPDNKVVIEGKATSAP